MFGGLEHEFYDFPFSWDFHHPNWRFVIFFRGVGRKTTNQIDFMDEFLRWHWKDWGGAMDVWISWRLNCWVFLAAVFGVFLAIDFHSLSRLNSEKTLTCAVKIRLILENQPLFASSNPKFPWPCGVCLRLRHLCPSRHLCGGAVAVG